MVRNSSSPDISVCTVQYIYFFVLIRFRLVWVFFFQFQRDVIEENNRNKRNIYPGDFRFLSSGSLEFQLVFLFVFFYNQTSLLMTD